MNAIKKMTVLFLLMVTVSTTKVAAQDFVNFQSSETGICVNVPDDMNVVEHTEDMLHLQNDLASLTIQPMLTEGLTGEAISNALREIASSVKMDISKMEETKHQTETLDMLFYSGEAEKGVIVAVGLLEPKGNDKVVYMMTLTYADGDGDEIVQNIMTSLEFNPDVIK